MIIYKIFLNNSSINNTLNFILITKKNYFRFNQKILPKMSGCNTEALIHQNDACFLEHRMAIHEPSLNFREVKYPRECVEAIKCEAQAKVCAEPMVVKCALAKVYCEPIVAKCEPAVAKCEPKTVCYQPFETKCELVVPKCEPKTVCYQPFVTKCEPAKVCCEPVVAKCEPAKVCLPQTVMLPNGFVQLTETRCEFRDHGNFDCKYDFKYTEAADHKLITKSHRNHISNMENTVSDAPTASTVEVVSKF